MSKTEGQPLFLGNCPFKMFMEKGYGKSKF